MARAVGSFIVCGQRALTRMSPALLALAVVMSCTAAVAQPFNGFEPDRTPDAYMARHGGTLAPAGRLEIDGRRMTCGNAPTVLDPEYGDYGAAFPGFLILNPRLFAGLATPVKLWIFSHECAHQTVGPNEARADCAAVQRGRDEGWLNASGLEQICEFMQPARPDSQHFSGPLRCELMRQCFQPKKDHAGQ